MKSLYIIRHGQSAANAGGVSLPDKNIPLTPLGEVQAQSLLERWQGLVDTKNMPIPTHLYHSQMRRAKQTALVFADGYEMTPIAYAPLNEMCCLGYSTVAGMIGKQRAPLAKQYWQTADIHYRDAHDADTFAEFLARVDTFIASVCQFETNSLFFGHGMWIGLLAYRLLGCEINDNADIQRFRQFQTAMPMYNTVVYRLDVSDDGVMQLRVMSELK